MWIVLLLMGIPHPSEKTQGNPLSCGNFYFLRGNCKFPSCGSWKSITLGNGDLVYCNSVHKGIFFTWM